MVTLCTYLSNKIYGICIFDLECTEPEVKVMYHVYLKDTVPV